ncbi:TonB-dependent receptor plug domain-containing protein [Alteromonas oceanisediminis]|uniref:TonB-dependent receptor plug domain-containing protein n=1 Tax=Alteromonas oceanisediminis TaxID=2836180 RepID=UPI001BDA2F9F|nr:TonB-dependent receptor [Alteromonas oceanisediminis]MBT0586133.1 TonB-dependent receptor [Alteromonas oceanisediminis]
MPVRIPTKTGQAQSIALGCLISCYPHLALSVEMSQELKDVEKIEITGKRNQAYTEPTEETERLLSIAGLDGDPLNAVFSMPGVVYAGGDSGGEPAVRGSSPDDNAFYVDQIPTDYIYHLFGDSIFNKNLLRSFDLEAAAFGPSYGNAVGGVFDVTLRDPRNQPLSVKLDASLLKTGALIEGGLSDNTAFYASYRRSLIHLFLPAGTEEEGISVFKAPVSDDYQGKYQWLIGDDQKLTFTVNGASDTGGFNISKASEEGRIDPDLIGDLRISTRFDSQGVQWESFTGEHSYWSTSFSHVKSKERESLGNGQFSNSKSTQYNTRLLYQTQLFQDHNISLGVDTQSNDVDYELDVIPYFCTDHDTNCQDQKGERIQLSDTVQVNVLAVYFNDNWQLSPTIGLDLGVRIERDDFTEKTFAHPRVKVNYMPTENLSLFASAGTYSRFPNVDQVLNEVGNPNLQPVKATHFATGAEYQITPYWHTRLELYYKDMENFGRALDLANDAEQLRYTNDLSGQAHGIEWLVERAPHNDWNAWFSVSWSQSERTDEITGRTTEYYLDTPVIVNSVVNYHLNDEWEVGLKYSLRSGARYTPITGIKPNPDFPENYLPIYGQLNSRTLPIYSRLDIQAKYKFQFYQQEAAVTFAVLNALGAENVSGYFFKPDGNETPDDFVIAKELGLEPFPSIGLELTF